MLLCSGRQSKSPADPGGANSSQSGRQKAEMEASGGFPLGLRRGLVQASPSCPGVLGS